MYWEAFDSSLRVVYSYLCYYCQNIQRLSKHYVPYGPGKVRWLVANYELGFYTWYEAIHFPEWVYCQHFFVSTVQWGGSLSVTTLKQLYTCPTDTATITGDYGTPCLEEVFGAPLHFAEHCRCPEKLIPSRRTSIFESLQYPNMVTNWCFDLTGKFMP
jgi:hypothetical protein